MSRSRLLLENFHQEEVHPGILPKFFLRSNTINFAIPSGNCHLSLVKTLERTMMYDDEDSHRPAGSRAWRSCNVPHVHHRYPFHAGIVVAVSTTMVCSGNSSQPNGLVVHLLPTAISTTIVVDRCAYHQRDGSPW